MQHEASFGVSFLQSFCATKRNKSSAVNTGTYKTVLAAGVLPAANFSNDTTNGVYVRPCVARLCVIHCDLEGTNRDFKNGKKYKMIVLITGASHTGKTALAQKLLEKYKYPYLSIDHLKMGLIRSGYTTLTPEDDNKLTEYLWPIVREIIKTAIENKQNLIIEGCYIPFDWEEDFAKEYRDNIRYLCLVMSENYIKNHFDNIKKYANAVENRLDDEWCTMESILEDNARFLELVKKFNVNYVFIDGKYDIEIDL